MRRLIALIRCGPGRLVSLYAAAAARLADLPPLPADLRAHAWLDLCPASQR